MAISFKRILRSGWTKFVRDRSSTGAALIVMTTALFVVSFLYVLQGLTSFVVEELQDSVDISAYFQAQTTEEQVFAVRQALLGMEEVKEVEYISKEQAFEIFIEAHRDDRELLEPLQAIGQNPFLASLNIKATNAEDFSVIADFLQDSSFAEVVDRVDFHDRQSVIERISLVAEAVRAAVIAVIVVLSAIAILVVFNTIRLTIYNSREEIEVMRLVGASNWFIRGPFLVQGILVGAAASIITLVIVFAVSIFTSGRLESFSGFSLSSFLGSEFFVLLLLQLAVGIGLGVVSSAIAIRKYLKV